MPAFRAFPMRSVPSVVDYPDHLSPGSGCSRSFIGDTPKIRITECMNISRQTSTPGTPEDFVVICNVRDFSARTTVPDSRHFPHTPVYIQSTGAMVPASVFFVRILPVHPGKDGESKGVRSHSSSMEYVTQPRNHGGVIGRKFGRRKEDGYFPVFA